MSSNILGKKRHLEEEDDDDHETDRKSLLSLHKVFFPFTIDLPFQDLRRRLRAHQKKK